MRFPRSWILALSLILPALGLAQSPTLKIPSLASMQRGAVERVNITLGPVVLWFAERLMSDGDPQGAELKRVLRMLHRVQVHSYRFGTDHLYRQEDLQALWSKLAAAGWDPIVQVRDRDTREDVDIYLALDDQKLIRGLVIVAAEPQEFTLVNITGRIDPGAIAVLLHTLVPDKSVPAEVSPARLQG